MISVWKLFFDCNQNKKWLVHPEEWYLPLVICLYIWTFPLFNERYTASCMFEGCAMHCMNSFDMPYDISGLDLWHWDYRGAIWIFHCEQCPSVCWLCPAYLLISGRAWLQGIVCWWWSEMQGNILYWLILLYQSGNLWSLLNYIAVLLLLLVGWLHTA